MNTKTILITGATDGIGKQTALELAQLGHEVIIHGRNELKGKKITEEISKISLNNKIHYLNADLSDFNQIKIFTDTIRNKFNKLDVLLNNAGIFAEEKTILPNGLESTFMINHMAYFTICKLLLDMLKETKQSRIVNVSSIAQSGSINFDNLNGEKSFDSYSAYSISKLENILFTYKLHREIKNFGLSANCLHPGIVNTKLLYAGWGSGGVSVAQGAKCSVYVAISKDIENISGRYFLSSQQKKSSAISYDIKIQNRLWEISEKIMSQHL
jgi:NAD(P)-dependent dehydrogenase (short-subunit alcohol dehydrogenase family)